MWSADASGVSGAADEINDPLRVAVADPTRRDFFLEARQRRR
jgi:hypothetical protein